MIFSGFDQTNREYHKFAEIPDMSDEISSIQQFKIIAD